MITQIELDGFKTFKDFKVELAPFQVIVGPNGSGKSNLFDALRLLSRLAETDLFTAFQGLRGDTDEVFTKLPNGRSIDRMSLAVEMLVNHHVQDNFGEKVELKYTRLRYELGIALRDDEYGLERPYITNESLRTISRDKDTWSERYSLSPQTHWIPQQTIDQLAFITTQRIDDLGPNTTHPKIMITLHPEKSGAEGMGRMIWAEHAQQTVLSGVTNLALPHAFAAREEMRSLRFFHLNPEALRKPGSVRGPRFLLGDGSNLPTVLARMQAEDEFALTDVSRDMANLVPGIVKMRVEKNAASNEYDIWAETSDQRSFSSYGLSDGTLRLLAIAVMRNDPQFHGVLCLEEPENGVDTLYLENMTRLLREMAIDFTDPQQEDEPLRQIVITTHSPLFISQPNVRDSLLLALMPTQVGGQGEPSVSVTRMVPVATPNILAQYEMNTDRDKVVEIYTIDMVRKYLDSRNLDDAREQLKKARATLI